MVARKTSLGELSSYPVPRSTVKGAALTDEELRKARIATVAKTRKLRLSAVGFPLVRPGTDVAPRVRNRKIDAVLQRRYLEGGYREEKK